jgi:hypothetical protein
MAVWLRRLAVVALVSIPSAAAAGELRVVNSSGKPIYELYMVPAGERSWGPDYLRRKQPSVIARGETYTLADIPPGTYQLMMVVDGSECQIDPVVIASEFRVDLTPPLLRRCSGSN